jgi:hypothetical protein
MSDQTSPIQRYARAAHRVDVARLSGQRPDPADVQEIAQLEYWAAQTFDQQQMGTLGVLVRDARAEYANEIAADRQAAAARDQALGDYRQSKAAMLAQAIRDAAIRDLTKNRFQEGAPGKPGLTEQQFHDLREHGRYVHPGVERLRDRIKRQNAVVHDRTVTDADIDKARQWASDLMEATEAERTKMLDAAGVSTDIVERNAYVRKITSDLIASELRERAEARTPKERFEPKVIEDPEAQRRAQVIFEIGRHTDPEVTLTDNIPPALLQEKSLHGDVARAVAAHTGEGDDGIDYNTVEDIAEGRA